MKSRPVVAALFVALFGCQSGDKAASTNAAPVGSAPSPPSAPVTTRTDEPYKNDVQKVCNVIELSGAAAHASNDRVYLVATWLGKHLETSDAQKWLASIQRLNGNSKADALEQEARRVGLASCALAAEWRSPPSP